MTTPGITPMTDRSTARATKAADEFVPQLSAPTYPSSGNVSASVRKQPVLARPEALTRPRYSSEAFAAKWGTEAIASALRIS